MGALPPVVYRNVRLCLHCVMRLACPTHSPSEGTRELCLIKQVDTSYRSMLGIDERFIYTPGAYKRYMMYSP